MDHANQSVNAENLAAAYEAFNVDPRQGLKTLEALYAEHLRFRDPLVKIEGRREFMKVMDRFATTARELRIDVLDAVQQDDRVFLTWKMTYAPRWGIRLKIDGATFARVREGKIVEQRDYWDLLDSLLSKVPPLERLRRDLVGRLW